MPIQHPRLHLLVVSQTVQTQFAHQQGTIHSQVMKPGQIGIELGLRFEIDIEAKQVQERQLEVLGGRIIGIGHQALGVLLLGRPVKTLDKTLHLAMPVPADQRGRDFIGHAVAEHRGMAGTAGDFLADHGFHRLCAFSIIQKRRGAFARQTHHHPQPITSRRIQQPARRNRIGSHRVHTVGRHLDKIALDCSRIRKFVAVGIRAEGAVGHPPDVKFFVADENEFASDMRPRVRSYTYAMNRFLRINWNPRTNCCP